MATQVELVDKLKITREMMGLSQRDLSGRIGIPRTTIAGWETGRKHPSPEHQRQVVIWLQQAEKQLSASSNPTPNDPPIIVSAPRWPSGRLPPQLRERVIECLKASMSHRQIKAQLKVDLHDITNIRHEAGIPVRTHNSKQADHIEQLWNIARNESRGFNPSTLSGADKINFAMALEDIRVWLTRYIEVNLADALDPKKIREEIKRVLK